MLKQKGRPENQSVRDVALAAETRPSPRSTDAADGRTSEQASGASETVVIAYRGFCFSCLRPQDTHSLAARGVSTSGHNNVLKITASNLYGRLAYVKLRGCPADGIIDGIGWNEIPKHHISRVQNTNDGKKKWCNNSAIYSSNASHGPPHAHYSHRCTIGSLDVLTASKPRSQTRRKQTNK